MNKKQTLLVVAPYFPPHSGGLERYAKTIVKKLSKNIDWNIVVLTTGDKDKDEIEKHSGYVVHRLSVSFVVSNTPFSFDWFFRVHKLLKKISPDIINIHTPVPGLGDIVALLAPRRTPIVVTYHTGTMKKGYAGVANAIIWLYEKIPLKYLLHRVNHIVCVSKFVSSSFLSKYKYKSSIITPAVDTALFTPDPYVEKSGKVLLFVASLNKGDEYKGLSVLLSALQEIIKEKKDIVLRVVGDGDMRSEYEEIVKNKGLSENVTFVGAVYGEELANEYRKADVFVLPTEKESFGMAVAEAMASGLPVVSTNVGGVPDVVKNGETGYLVGAGNIRALSEKVLELLNDSEKRINFGLKAQAKIKRKFTWNDRVDDYIILFKNLLEQKPTVAQVVGFYPPHVGGMEVVAKEVSLELARRGYPVRVFTSDIGAKNEERVVMKSNYILHRLRSIELFHTPVMFTLPLRLLFLPKNTIVHVHLAQAGIPEIALLIAKIRRFKYIAHFHLDVEPSGKLGRLFLLYKKYILGMTLRNADAIIVFSEEQKSLIINKYFVKENNIKIIPNGVNVKFFENKNRIYGRPKKLLAVSRLTVQKRVDRIVEAVSMIKKDVELAIVGDGEDRDKLKFLADNVARGRVRFVGEKKPEELCKYYNDADIFVIPSDKEGMSIAVLEAMSAGLPIVGSNVLGVRELVFDTGILVNNPSPKTFAKEISKLLNDKEKIKVLSENSINKANKYSWENSVDKLSTLYKNI